MGPKGQARGSDMWAPCADSSGGSGIRGQRTSLLVFPATRAATMVGGLPVPVAKVARVWWGRKTLSY